MEDNNSGRVLELVKIGGYLIAGGALSGFSIGAYFLFDRALFSYFVQIAQLEVLSYFLAVFMPSFIVLIVIGYLFATTLGIKKVNLSTVGPLCALSLLSITLSALSIFYFISFLGGFLTLIVLIRAYTKPDFNSLQTNLAFFFVEFGAILVASFSALFLLVWVISNFFATFGMGFLGNYSPIALLFVAVFSLLMFIGIPLWGSRGTNAGLCAMLGFAMTLISYFFVTQSSYSLFNSSAYIGITMLIAGFALIISGNLLYLTLFLYAPGTRFIPVTSTLYQGQYCPYCASPRLTAVQNLCSNCGRNLMWTPYAPFCSSCGRLVPSDAQTCPHCREDIRNKRINFDLTVATEQVVAEKLIAESIKQKSRIMRSLERVSKPLKIVTEAFAGANKFLQTIFERTNLTLKELVFVVIIAYVFGFVSFIGYVRVEPSRFAEWNLVVSNYGFPLEWLRVRMLYPIWRVHDIEIQWLSLTLDLILYFSGAFSLVYGAQRLRR